MTLIEDVITTGGAVRDATNALRAAGAIVETVVCAIDRSPAGENPLADVGLEVRAVLTRAELDAAPTAVGWIQLSGSTFWPAMSRSGTPSPSLSSASGALVRLCRHHSQATGITEKRQDHDDRVVDVLARAPGTPRRGSSRAA